MRVEIILGWPKEFIKHKLSGQSNILGEIQCVRIHLMALSTTFDATARKLRITDAAHIAFVLGGAAFEPSPTTYMPRILGKVS